MSSIEVIIINIILIIIIITQVYCHNNNNNNNNTAIIIIIRVLTESFFQILSATLMTTPQAFRSTPIEFNFLEQFS